MGKVNACLKRGYLILTCVIGIISALLFGITLYGHGFFTSSDEIEEMILGIKILYSVSTVTLLLAILGVYGACKERIWPLIVFTSGMSLAIVFICLELIGIIILEDKEVEQLRINHLAILNEPNEIAKENFYEMQIHLECCGMEQGYQDWGFDIPESCLCVSDSRNDCIAAPRNSSLYENKTKDEPIMIYKEPCISILMFHTHLVFKIASAIIAGLLIMWTASVLLGAYILVQLRRKVDVPPVHYSVEAKAGNYTTLSENE